ncbi:MAG: tripartite tricarboxylate transporter TctB family protein [Burkholderiales bacterium]
MRRFLEGRVLFSLFLAAVGAFAVGYALGWPFKAALFPLIIGIPLLCLALLQAVLDLRGKTQAAEGPIMDLQHAADVPPAIAQRRTLAIFAWMAGFIVLVLFAGFPIAVPLFAFSYLFFGSPAGWRPSLVLAAAAWIFFNALFERLLHLQFEAGLVQTWIGLD